MTSEQALRRMRQRIFDYPEHKEAQAQRVLLYLKHRMMRNRRNQPDLRVRGPYSGLTRAEMPGWLCETDFF